MKAVLCKAYGPPETLAIEELPSPMPGAGEAVVSVKAAGVNFPDVLIIQNKYQFKPPLPFSPGSELAGVVKEVGTGVSNVRPGDRVIAFTTYGAFAEEVKTEAVRLLARFLFEQRGHHRITIDPAAANEPAIRCYAKVGFRPVGIMRQYERGPDGTFHDGLLMDLLRDYLHRERPEIMDNGIRLHAIGELEIDARRKCLPHLALRALHVDGAVHHLDGDAFGNRDRFLANA